MARVVYENWDVYIAEWCPFYRSMRTLLFPSDQVPKDVEMLGSGSVDGVASIDRKRKKNASTSVKKKKSKATTPKGTPKSSTVFNQYIPKADVSLGNRVDADSETEMDKDYGVTYANEKGHKILCKTGRAVIEMKDSIDYRIVSTLANEFTRMTNVYPCCDSFSGHVLRNEWGTMLPRTDIGELLVVNTHCKRDGGTCSNHPDGCGKELIKEGMLVCMRGEDTALVARSVWYVGVYSLNASVGKGTERTARGRFTCGCKVGVTKAIYKQLSHITNRYGVVTNVVGPVGGMKHARTGLELCNGHAFVAMLDNPSMELMGRKIG